MKNDAHTIHRLPVIGVMGSGRARHEARARQVGTWLAEAGVHLLTGGGGGVMAAVAEAFCRVPEREGLSIGILPCSEDDRTRPRAGYPNPWVELPIQTHLPWSGTRGIEFLSRNHLNVLTPDAVIALPGGSGTLTEVQLALAYGTPVIAFLHDLSEIENLPVETPVTSKWSAVQAFIQDVLSLQDV